jgi:hypothetical protein
MKKVMTQRDERRLDRLRDIQRGMRELDRELRFKDAFDEDPATACHEKICRRGSVGGGLTTGFLITSTTYEYKSHQTGL